MQKRCTAAQPEACREVVFDSCEKGHYCQRLCCEHPEPCKAPVAVQCKGSAVTGAVHTLLRPCHKQELPPCGACDRELRSVQRRQACQNKLARCDLVRAC